MSTASSSHWQRFQQYFLRYNDLGFTLDISRMGFPDTFLSEMEPAAQKAYAAMKDLESGGMANPDEQRMVGHYWLRNPALAPTKELADTIQTTLDDTLQFADDVKAGKITAPNGKRFTRVVIVGIGGSALGPQLIADALTVPNPPLAIDFFDNTDPEGMDRIAERIGDEWATTLTLVISKSGGTKETRNGMLEAQAAYTSRGLAFPAHAVAITGEGSELDKHAIAQGWMKRFPMWDWVGGRTSVMSAVGTVAAALQGVDVRQLLAGAAAMDDKTRTLPTAQNASMLLALMWYHAGKGKGLKDMVILPYKDRLVLMSKYLQQLVMESLGKELDLDGKVVNQGIAVYGNKGSTDQHAYVQQLRDGINNFFATFIEIRQGRAGQGVIVEDQFSSGDYLQGFLRGTRSALTGGGRESITISLPVVDAFRVGVLIALYERAVSFYATLVNINAYHQPGVEAGKKAATEFLKLLGNVRDTLKADGASLTAESAAAKLGADPEDVYYCLQHLAANGHALVTPGATPAVDEFVSA